MRTAKIPPNDPAVSWIGQSLVLERFDTRQVRNMDSRFATLLCPDRPLGHNYRYRLQNNVVFHQTSFKMVLVTNGNEIVDTTRL
jgi:hypothetical protein